MNLATIIDDHPAGHVALVSGPERIGYGRLREDAGRVRAALLGAGLVPGDRVAIVCGITERFVRAWLGVLGAGMVAVPLNPQSPAPELEGQLEAVGARAAIVGPAGLTAVKACDRTRLTALEHVFVPGGAADDTTHDLDAVTSSAPVHPCGDEALAALLFTSGTAGTPRAARLTHGSLAANLRQLQSHESGGLRPDDVVACVVPLHHVLGLNSILGLGLMAGATVVLVERFDPVSLVETVTAEAVSVLAGPPTMWAALGQLDPLPPEGLSSVRLAASGAAPLSERIAETARLRLGVPLVEGYGLTEASPSVTLGVHGRTPPGSIGRPLAGVEVRLVDRGGDDVLVGDPGEIWVRGPNVFDGYWNDPETSAAAVDPDGWLHTGDLAVVDDDGHLYIVDRVKDSIIVSGFNVHPAEVEEVLAAHEAVADVAVVGVPHPHSGETVKAYVVPVDQRTVDEDELVEWVAARLARYKCPTKIDLVDEIPRGMGGKLLRRRLG